MTDLHIPRAHIVFDEACPDPFKDLVNQTLASSEFISSNRITLHDEGYGIMVSEPVPLHEVEGAAAKVTFQPQVDPNYGPVRNAEASWSYLVPLEDALTEDGLLPPEGSPEADRLRKHENAPHLVQAHEGPFELTVEEVLAE